MQDKLSTPLIKTIVFLLIIVVIAQIKIIIN